MADQQNFRDHFDAFPFGPPHTIAPPRFPHAGATLVDLEAFVELPAETHPADRRAIVELWRRAEAEALLSGELLRPSAN